MKQTGTAAFLDFQESDVAGTRVLRAAQKERVVEAFILERDLLIHMVHAKTEHLDRVAEQSVPVPPIRVLRTS